MTKTRFRSLEVACIYKVRDANRVSALAWQTFNAAPDRTRITEYLNEWQTAENKVARCRSMRNAASSVAIRRSRHGLMLAAARHGVDAYALLDWETNSPEQLANDPTLIDKALSGLVDSGKTGNTLAAVSWLKENGAITATGNKLNLNEIRLAELGF